MAQAIHITVLGMALVFLALAVVMLVALILSRLFQPLPGEEQAASTAQPSEEPADEEARIAAVIAATLTTLEQEMGAEVALGWPDSVLTLKHGSQGWKVAGRLAGMR